MEFQGNDISIRVTDYTIRMESVVDDSNRFTIVEVGNRFLLRTQPHATVRFTKKLTTRSAEPNFTFRSDEEGNVELGSIESGVYRASVNDSEPETVVMAKSPQLHNPSIISITYDGPNDYELRFESHNYNISNVRTMLGSDESKDIEYVNEFVTISFNSSWMEECLPAGWYYVYSYIEVDNEIITRSEYTRFELPTDE